MALPNDDEIQDIIPKILAGESRLFKNIVQRHSAFAYDICYRILKNREDSEEAVQDAFVKVYRYLRTYQKKAKFTTWLYRIVYREALRHANKKNKRVEFTPVGNDLPEPTLANSRTDYAWERLHLEQQRKYLRRAIDTLPEHEAIVVNLFFIEELSIREICQVVGIRESACKLRLHRAKKRMFHALDRLLKEELKNLL